MTNMEIINRAENIIHDEERWRALSSSDVATISAALLIARVRECASTEANDPLTLEGLRGMDGEPVWVQSPGVPEYGRWAIVTGVDTEDGERTLYCQGDYTCRDYGKTWVAYRRPPEGDEE